jgi:hypothetical protein
LKYDIAQSDDRIEIRIDESAEQQPALVAAFRRCQDGSCKCPSQENRKLEGLQISTEPARIRLVLVAKDGEVLDRDRIERCMLAASRRARRTTGQS